MDVNILLPLSAKLKSPEFLNTATFKRCLELLQAQGKASEHEAALMWFSQEKSKLEGDLKVDGQKAVNIDSVISDYFEKSIKKESTATDAINKLFF